MRLPRTATIAIVGADRARVAGRRVLLGVDEQAALALGFIPARLSGARRAVAAVPAFLTPLTATLVHAGLIHLGFNLLMLRVVRDARSSGCSGDGPDRCSTSSAPMPRRLAQWAVDPMRRWCR